MARLPDQSGVLNVRVTLGLEFGLHGLCVPLLCGHAGSAIAVILRDTTPPPGPSLPNSIFMPTQFQGNADTPLDRVDVAGRDAHTSVDFD